MRTCYFQHPATYLGTYADETRNRLGTLQAALIEKEQAKGVATKPMTPLHSCGCCAFA